MAKINTLNYQTVASWNGSQDLFVVEQPDGTKVATPAQIKQYVLGDMDEEPTQDSDKPVKSGGIYTALGAKQNTLTFDNVPIQNSNNPVKSGGLFTALADKQDKLTIASGVITLSTGWNFDGGVVNTVKRMGDIAWLSSYIYSTNALTANAVYEVGTLPANFIPSKSFKTSIYPGTDLSTLRGLLEIKNDGKIMYRSIDTSRYAIYTTIIYPLT